VNEMMRVSSTYSFFSIHPGGIFSHVSIAVFLLDQLVKTIIQKSIPFLSEIRLTSFFSIAHVRNTGVAWGMLQGIQLIPVVFALAVVFGILLYQDKLFKQPRIVQVACALILGGALGNLFDRLLYGFVVDYISFSFWPAFNVADSALCIGALLLVYNELVESSRKKK